MIVSLPPDFLSALLEDSPAGVLYLQPAAAPDFVVAFSNPAARQLLGPLAEPGTALSHWPADHLVPQLRTAYARPAGAPPLGLSFSAGRHLTARRVGEGLLLQCWPTEGAELTAARTAQYQSEVRESAAYAEANRQREQLYSLLEQAPALICVLTGPDHVYQFVNSAYQATVGERQLLGLPVRLALPEVAEHGIVEQLTTVYESGETYEAHEMLVQPPAPGPGRPQPAPLYYNFIYQARRNQQREVDGIYVFAYDVTPQVLARQLIQQHTEVLEARVQTGIRRAAQERDQQQLLLHGLFLEAPAPIAILAGPDMVYQLVNPAYQQIFPGRQLLHRPLVEALPELADTAIPPLLRQVYTTGETYVARERALEIARVEGGPLETTYFNFTYQARRTAEGQIDGVLIFAYDVTPQVQARLVLENSQQQTQHLANELQKTNTQLMRANADLDTFVYMASHDLKAPITNIDGLLQALRHELALPAAEADTATVLRLMQDSVNRFQRTIKYLTEVSRWQQVQELPAATVVVAELVAEVCRDLAPLLAVTGGHVEVAADGCPQLLFAEKHLRSLLYNLISNALKYRSPERVPLVQVRCALRPDGGAVLEVQDNGLGLTPEQQQRVFGMFQRLHDHVEGSGIGLYLAKQVVEKAGGQLSVHSEYGVGSIFRAILPQLTIP